MLYVPKKNQLPVTHRQLNFQNSIFGYVVYTYPCAIIESATLINPPMLAPLT